MLIRTGLVLCVVLSTVACDDTEPTPTLDAGTCTDEAVTMDFSVPGAFTCNEDFVAQVQVRNGSCRRLSITAIRLTASVTDGRCEPAAPGDYDAQPASLAAGATATVLDLTAPPFCCLAPGCPDPLLCTERFDVELTTSEGTLTASASTDLILSGCNVVCE